MLGCSCDKALNAGMVIREQKSTYFLKKFIFFILLLQLRNNFNYSTANYSIKYQFDFYNMLYFLYIMLKTTIAWKIYQNILP